ncbi:MAG: DUF167 domain-containing protein [Anaerolineales bacterium]|jgi:uncharacterized protein YggU (UPF0235/DUF167 family)
MIGREFRFHDGGQGAALAIRVKFGSKTRRILKVLKDGTVVVGLPGAGKDANKELLQFLANEFDIDQEKLQIIAGHEGKNKLISVLQFKPEDIQQLVLEKIS